MLTVFTDTYTLIHEPHVYFDRMVSMGLPFSLKGIKGLSGSEQLPPSNVVTLLECDDFTGIKVP